MESKLQELLNNKFDVPDGRRDISVEGNLRWLARNFAVRNLAEPNFTLTAMLIRDVAKSRGMDLFVVGLDSVNDF